MRSQRRVGQTVQLIHVTTTKDRLGNKTTTVTTTNVEGALFEPERILERPGEEQATVLQPATWNLPGVHQVDADDQIKVGSNTWYVVGAGQVWLDRTKVPVQQTRGV